MQIDVAGVVGLGTMGAGIAEVLARAGREVVAVEIDDSALDAGRSRILASFRRAVERGRLEPGAADQLASRLSFTTSRADLSSAGLVVEAVPERLAVKVELFDELDRHCPPDTILATNTSSLPVTAIAAATGRPGRVIGMHFFNPAPAMRLVEIVTTVLADVEAVESVRQLAVDCGKTPVVVGDRAGFIANALLLPYLNDAARLVETRQAAVDEIDAAVMQRTGLPMGPFTLMDLIGLDVCVPILDVLWDEFRDGRYAASPLLRRLATARWLGRKSGRGWYSYDGSAPAPSIPVEPIPVEPISVEPISVQHRGDVEPVASGLVERHLADAVRMRDEGYATAADIDTAMRLGCGYPKGPFELLEGGVRPAARS